MDTLPHIVGQPQSQIVEDVIAARVAAGASLSMVVTTASMAPLLRPGDRIHVSGNADTLLPFGVIVVVRAEPRPIVHRVVGHDRSNPIGRVITKGDASGCCDIAIPLDQVIGVVASVERRHRRLALTTPFMRWLAVGIAWWSLLTACPPGLRRTAWQRILLHGYRAVLHPIAAVAWLSARSIFVGVGF